MIVEIWKNKVKIKQFEKKGRYNFAILEDDSLVKTGDLNYIEIKCSNCSVIREIKWRSGLLKKKYFCFSCLTKGENNPFFGKTHSDKTKKIHSEKMKGKYAGDKNPFYGKEHTKDVKVILSNKTKEWHKNNDNPFKRKSHSKETQAFMRKSQKEFRERLTEQEKNEISKIHSASQKKLQERDPEKYRENRIKAAKAAACSHVKYKMNNLEKLFETLLQESGIELKYSIILNYFQFDFGHKESKTLIEIQGDYWHGNPKFYKEECLNEVQKKNKKRDLEKKEWAVNNGFKLLVFWEDEIYSNPNKIKQEALNAIKIQIS